MVARRDRHRLVAFADLKNEAVLRQLRNVMAFHLGKPYIVERGIRRVAGAFDPDERRPLVLVSSDDGGTRVHARHDFGPDVMLAGIRVPDATALPDASDPTRWLTNDDLVSALTEARDGHFRLARLIDEVFFDALREAGAELDPLEPSVPDEDEDDDRGTSR